MVRAHGRVERLLPVHGVAVTDGGAEIHFHRNAVVDGRFDRLQVGDSVDLLMAEEGTAAQARAVIPCAGRETGKAS